MLNLERIIIQSFVRELKRAYQQNFDLMGSEIPEILTWFCHLALENIANCNALYHNVEHTIMVVSAGQEILRGKHMREGDVTPRDWLNFTVALLCHDIGYVRGICRADGRNHFATGVGDASISLTPGATDAALAPYHVDRSKLFVRECFAGKSLDDADVEVIVKHIEMTRFPIPDGEFYQETHSYSALVRAADLIGQLGDPGYIRKLPALFFELEETGANAKIGYTDPENMRQRYSKFYWNVISPYIQEGIKYLRVTHEGKQWVSNLHSHVFAVEHGEG